MQEINLLQNKLKEKTFAWDKESYLVVWVLGFILAVLVLGGGGLMFLSKQTADKTVALMSTNQDIQNKLNDSQDKIKGAAVYQAQLENLKTLVTNHTYLSPLLDELEKMAYVKSQYVTVDIIQPGKIHLEGKVASYTDLGKMLLGLNQSKQFKNIKLLSVVPFEGAEQAYLLAVDLTVDPGIFIKQ